MNDELLNKLLENGLLDMNTRQLIALAALGLMVYQINRNKVQAMELPPKLEDFPVQAYLPQQWTIPGVVGGWQTPPAGMKYEAWFKAAGVQYGLPPGLLSRVAYQESRYKPNAVSPAGAIGLMQIVPRWHPNVDPRDPKESIFYAARYLKDLRKQTGSWIMALAAYNWGIGNLTRKGIDRAPKETQDYIAEISRDVKLA